MIFTKKEIKQKSLEEILHLIDNDEDLLIVKDQDSFYEALLLERKNGKTFKMGPPKEHVERILKEIENES